MFNLDLSIQKEKLIDQLKANRKRTLLIGLFLVLIFLTIIYLGPLEGLERFGLLVQKKEKGQPTRAQVVSQASYYVAREEQVDTTTVGWQPLVTLNVNESTGTWLILVYVEGRHSGVVGFFDMRLLSNRGGELARFYKDPEDANQWFPFHFFKIVNITSPRTYTIEWDTSVPREISSTRRARIAALRLDTIFGAAGSDSFRYLDSDSSVRLNSSTWKDLGTVSFTPASSSDYLILASAALNHGQTNNDGEFRLNIDGANFIPVEQNGDWWAVTPKSTDKDKIPVFIGRVVNLAATPHTIKFEGRSESDFASANADQRRLIVLRLTDKVDYYYNESTTPESSSTSDTKAKVTQTQNYAAGNWLIMGGATQRVESNAAFGQVAVDLDGGGTVSPMWLTKTKLKNTENWLGKYGFSQKTFTGESHTLKVLWDAAGGTAKHWVKSAWILAFKMPTELYVTPQPTVQVSPSPTPTAISTPTPSSIPTPTSIPSPIPTQSPTSTLSVTLSGNVSYPWSSTNVTGKAPLMGVDLSAYVSGDVVGASRYRFDCTNDGIFERDASSKHSIYFVLDICSYSSNGTYTALVRVDNEGRFTTDTLTINVE